MIMTVSYCCTDLTCGKSPLREEAAGLRCPNGHFFPFVTGTNVPVFACEEEGSNEYAIENAAEIHDNALQWVFRTFQTDEATLRKSLIARLRLSKGQTVLVTGAGAGNDLPFLAEALDTGIIYAQDIAIPMLMSAVERHGAALKNSGVQFFFSASDATNLPFQDGQFDAAYHFGGINLFPDIEKGMAEMNRVVKPGGRIVICDEGVAPWVKVTEVGKMLINNNPLYAFDAPLASLPAMATDVTLSWELSGCFYVIDFVVSKTPSTIDIDVPHIGRRGGTVRTRYFGVLEGIDPAIKARIYAEAEKRGISRVSFIEQLLLRDEF
ncbi:class I SAM-dependent methyltransferase [Neorhizobium vignae]|uniref:class I SAM-dependent methyltransferase n=1 Tax=Neorhizobium vignae TaxID=690585 RepID=UPI000A049762|nr:methyltransferase domain-containing protein [Neorhizobium vignae]